jgi:hypothetical protein
VDGRITIVSYALGEESFVDLNGNNTYDPGVPGEPFQDLGNVYKDRVYDGFYDARDEEFIPLEINNAAVCANPNSDLLLLNAYTPTVPGTCDGRWSGAGQVYVRRAVETVLSSSSARPLWGNTSRLESTCNKVLLQDGPGRNDTRLYTRVLGDTWYGGAGGVLTFIAADANPGRLKPITQWTGPVINGSPTFDPLTDYDYFPRLNPMAAGTVVSAEAVTTGLTVTVAGGSPIPDTLEASFVGIGYTFSDPAVSAGTVAVTFRSPSGVATTYTVNILRSSTPPSTCP